MFIFAGCCTMGGRRLHYMQHTMHALELQYHSCHSYSSCHCLEHDFSNSICILDTILSNPIRLLEPTLSDPLIRTPPRGRRSCVPSPQHPSGGEATPLVRDSARWPFRRVFRWDL